MYNLTLKYKTDIFLIEGCVMEWLYSIWLLWRYEGSKIYMSKAACDQILWHLYDGKKCLISFPLNSFTKFIAPSLILLYCELWTKAKESSSSTNGSSKKLKELHSKVRINSFAHIKTNIETHCWWMKHRAFFVYWPVTRL